MISSKTEAQGNAAHKPVTTQAPVSRQQSGTSEVADKHLKGPKGETVYTSQQGGKYYYAADGRKIFMESVADKNMKGPNGETVYITASGNKYYFNKKGEKVHLNKDQQTEKPAPDKKGTIKKADTPSK